jgi:DNA modification methylase
MTDLIWHTEQRVVSSLVPYEHNPRQITEKQAKELTDSLNDFGLVEIPAIDTDNTICAGHMRLMILKQLGRENETIDVRVPNRKLTEEEFKEYNLRSNKNTAGWNYDEIEDNYGMDMLEKIGFTKEELGFGIEEIVPNEKDDDVPAVSESEPISQLGDIWQLGKHKILCADCLVVDNVKLLMEDIKVDLGFNDPPYGMKKESDGVVNDNLNADDLLSFNAAWILNQFEFLKDNGSFYCWGTDESLMDIHCFIMKDLIKKQKATFRNLITWDKGDAGAGGVSFIGKDGLRSYPVADEKLLFYMCGVQGFNNNADNYFEGWESIRSYLEEEFKASGLTRNKLKEITGVDMYSHWFARSQWTFIPEVHYKKIQDYCFNNDVFKKDYDVIKKDYDVIKKDYDVIKKEFYDTRSYFDNVHENMTTVWNFRRHQRDGSEGGHATPKPIDLCSRAIISSCPENGTVLDFFLGSGSTLIACEKTNRICYGMEISPRYIDVVIKRWVRFMIENKKESEIILKRNGEDFDYRQLL